MRIRYFNKPILPQPRVTSLHALAFSPPKYPRERTTRTVHYLKGNNLEPAIRINRKSNAIPSYPLINVTRWLHPSPPSFTQSKPHSAPTTSISPQSASPNYKSTKRSPRKPPNGLLPRRINYTRRAPRKPAGRWPYVSSPYPSPENVLPSVRYHALHLHTKHLRQILLSLLSSLAAIFYLRSRVPGLGVAVVNIGVLVAARAHVGNFWKGKAKIPLPGVGDYNDAISKTQEIRFNSAYLAASWGVTGLLTLISR